MHQPTATAQSVQAPSGKATVLSIRELSKTFPGTRALMDFSVDIRKGEVHALVGQNGSGKSTVIKILAGFHAPDPGSSAEVLGKALTLGDSASSHAAGLRFVHQDLGLVPTLNTVDNFALGAGYHTSYGWRIRWRPQVAAVREAIDAVGLTTSIDVHRPVDSLAAVERTAVAIARALQGAREHEITLLVLDEPTATMPKADVDRLFHIVHRLREQGVSVLFVSHHLDEVFAIADRVTILRDGRKVVTTATGDLTRHGLIELMTGGVLDEPTGTPEASDTPPVLEVAGLAGHELRGLDLTVRQGEVVGVAGLSGSGRDELCGMIFGGRPRRGVVTVNDRVVAPVRPDEAIARGIGYVPADRHRAGLVLDMNIRENLTLTDLSRFWKRLRIGRRRERQFARNTVAHFGIKVPDIEASPNVLSGGNQQKVVLAKWLEQAPAVILLEEPTQGVDVGAKAEVHRLVDEAAQAGTAVLVCSSDETELERLCSRVVILRDGLVEKELAGAAVTARRIAQAALGTDKAKTEGITPR